MKVDGVVVGQRALQASSDILLGTTTIAGRPYFLRQMKNMKASIPVEWLTGESFNFYTWACGTLLARGPCPRRGRRCHRGLLRKLRGARPGAGDLGRVHGDQTEQDHDRLVKSGKVKAVVDG
jgi:uncharacterized protein DUF2252